MRSGLQRRLISGLSVLILLLLLVTGAALTTLNYMIRVGLHSALSEERVSYLANDVAKRALLCRSYEKDFLLNIDNPAGRERALKAWRLFNRELEDSIDSFDKATEGEEDRRRVEIWRAAMRFYTDGFQQAADAVMHGKPQSNADALRLFQPSGENVTTLTELAVAASEDKRHKAEEAGRGLERLGRRATLSIALLGAAAVAFAVAWSGFFLRRLTRPILTLRDAAVRLGEGDLSARAEVERQDELGELAERFNHMAQTIGQRSSELEAQYQRAEAARAEAEAASARIVEQLETIRTQQALIRNMSVPILPLSDSTLVIPLVGEFDSERLSLAQERVLKALNRSRARFLILDITAVPVVDMSVADGIIRLVRAAELLGAHTVLVGIRPDVATSLVKLGVDLNRLTTQRSLQSGIAYTLSRAGREKNA